MSPLPSVAMLLAVSLGVASATAQAQFVDPNDTTAMVRACESAQRAEGAGVRSNELYAAGLCDGLIIGSFGHLLEARCKSQPGFSHQRVRGVVIRLFRDNPRKYDRFVFNELLKDALDELVPNGKRDECWGVK